MIDETAAHPSGLTLVAGGRDASDEDLATDVGREVLTRAVLKVATSTAVGKERLSVAPAVGRSSEEP